MPVDRRARAQVLVVVDAMALGGCSASQQKLSTDAAVSLDMTNPCRGGATVPLGSFETGLQGCAATYAVAITHLDCVHQEADCTGFHVYGIPGPYVQWDCVYDATTGQLAGADYFNDEGGISCNAGVQPASCGFTGYAHGDVCPDGGN